MREDLSVQVGTRPQLPLSNDKFIVQSCFCKVAASSYTRTSYTGWYPLVPM